MMSVRFDDGRSMLCDCSRWWKSRDGKGVGCWCRWWWWRWQCLHLLTDQKKSIQVAFAEISNFPFVFTHHVRYLRRMIAVTIIAQRRSWCPIIIVIVVVGICERFQSHQLLIQLLLHSLLCLLLLLLWWFSFKSLNYLTVQHLSPLWEMAARVIDKRPSPSTETDESYWLVEQTNRVAVLYTAQQQQQQQLWNLHLSY